MRGPFIQDGEILSHKDCGGIVYHIGSDGISYCESCETICEGETEYVIDGDALEAERCKRELSGHIETIYNARAIREDSNGNSEIV